MSNKILLPKVYENNASERFPQHLGKPKASYSLYSSWNTNEYRGACFARYFLGIDDPGNIFTDFGSKVGEWFEKGIDESGELSDDDIKALESVGRPEGAEYEREIVLDMGDYVVQGFIDRNRIVTVGKKSGVEIIDFKTGSEKKKEEYTSDKYQQTTLYCKALIEEGETILYSGVKLLERKGNGREGHPLRLTGEVFEIPTPYSEERFELFAKELNKTVEDISDTYKWYLKYFKKDK